MRRRIAALIVLLLAAVPAASAERWWEAYNRGVKAVNAQQWDVAVSALEAAIAAAPAENNAARVRNTALVYVPHFWLGVARFHLGDIDGALREWKISESQGAIARTEHYPRLREWISKAQSEKKRDAADAAAATKKTADTAVSAALSAQIAALSAGADRSDAYRTAQSRLQEARTQYRDAGTSIAAFERAAQTATAARDLFNKAADDARKQRAARPPAIAARPPAAPAPVPQPAQAPPASVPAEIASTPEPVEIAAPSEPAAPPPAAAESIPQLAEPVPVIVEQRPPDPAPSAPTVPAVNAGMIAAAASETALRSQLESAYRFYASGDFNASERALSSILERRRSAEAYLLRGCARYTRALLSRTPDEILAAASSDFKAALKVNRNLRLDKRAFSPKLVEFFESVRNSS
ncbi:MAG TPA: hypothetical protein VNA04_18460 [Thermoanaerobaculia bacterium]|nr:hypothetical protein [Thermoanaerobaculia bacterium]